MSIDSEANTTFSNTTFIGMPNISLSSDYPQGHFLLGKLDSDLKNKLLLCDHSLDLIFWVVDAFIGLLILAGNLFASAVFIFGGNLRQGACHMNSFLLSLAVSDMLLALIVIPSYGAYCTGCAHTLSTLCWFFEGGKDYTFLASVFNLLAISYDRHLAVFGSLLYNIKMTPKRVMFILLLVWVLPGILAALRNAWQHVEDPEAVKQINLSYTYVLLFGFVIIPILIVSVVNIRIIIAIKTQVKKISGTSGNTSIFSHLAAIYRHDRETIRRNRGTLSCVVVVAIFVICWLPRACYYFLHLCNRQDLGSPLLLKLSVTFLLFQSSLNPVIYSFYRLEFRQAAKRLLRCH